MTIFGYARVAAAGQTLDAQVRALKGAGCEQILRETIAGGDGDHAQLARLLTTIHSCDVLIVERLEILARSTRELLGILDALAQRGAAFRSLGEEWADTTTPHGRSFFPMLRGLVGFERELIRRRTGEGRARARARGAAMGRPPKLTPVQRREALRSLAGGAATQTDLARRFGVSKSTISRLAANAASLVAAPARRPLDSETERAARAFMKRLEGKYLASAGLVFGSRARGAHRPDSDADLAVILKGEHGDRYQVSGEMAAIAFDLMLETGVLVDPLPLWEDELEHPDRFSNPALIENIKREGQPL